MGFIRGIPLAIKTPTNENAPDSVESLGRSLNSLPPKSAHDQPNGSLEAGIWPEWANLETGKQAPRGELATALTVPLTKITVCGVGPQQRCPTTSPATNREAATTGK